MKTKLLLVVGLLLTFNSLAQDYDSLNNEKLKEIEKKIDGFTDKRDSIGYIQLTKMTIPVYKNDFAIEKKIYDDLHPSNKFSKRHFFRKSYSKDLKKRTWVPFRRDYFSISSMSYKETEIKEVSIEIRNGTITSIFVKTNGAVFSNSRSFIELSEINNRRCDRLFTASGDHIKICDFLTYIGSRAFPSDTSYLFTKETEKKDVHIQTGLNNVFQARIYSDLLGLAGDESNGLLQSEVGFKSNLHNRNVQNKPFYWTHYISAEAGLARFDSKFRTINGQDFNIVAGDSTNSDSLTLDYMDIYQQSFVFSTLKINLFEWFVNRSYSSLSLNLIAGLNAARYQDSASLPVRRINMPHLGFEGLFHAKPYDNFGLIAGLSYQKMFFYGIEDVPTLGRSKWLFRASMEMYWNPNGKETNRIFARFRYIDTFGESQPFSQFQIGYAVNLSEWAKAKE